MQQRTKKQRRRDKVKVQEQIFYVYHCDGCPFLGVWPTSDDKYYLSGCRLIPERGDRRTLKENEEKQRRIKEAVRSDSNLSYTWTPDYCPLREHGHGGITVMYRRPEDYRQPSERLRIEDYYCSVARQEQETRAQAEARRREIEEAKQRKEARQREREEAKQKRLAASIERENARRQRKAEAAERQAAQRKKKEGDGKK